MYERTYNSRVLKTEDKKPQKRKGFPWKSVLIASGVAVVLVGIVFLVRVPRFQVKTINVVGTNVVDPSDISQFGLNTLEGTYAWVLPKTSIFLVSNDTMANLIAKRFPRLKSVEVDRDGMNSLRVTVVEFPGVYLWCDDACAFMDEQGTVFADAPYFSGSAYLKIYIGTREQYPFVPITVAQIQMVAYLKERLEAIDIAPVSVRFDSDRRLIVGFIHHTHEAGIYFDPTEDIDQALETLYSGLRTEGVARQYHDSSKVLQYLDVRFANKLIYKFQ